MEDIRIFAEDERELEILIKTISISIVRFSRIKIKQLFVIISVLESYFSESINA